jgi:hypothetical protein
MCVALAGALALGLGCKDTTIEPRRAANQELAHFKDGIERICRFSTSEVALRMKDGKTVILQSIGPLSGSNFSAKIQLPGDKTISINLPASVGLTVQHGEVSISIPDCPDCFETINVDVPPCEKGQIGTREHGLTELAALHAKNISEDDDSLLLIGGAIFLGYAALSSSSSK